MDPLPAQSPGNSTGQRNAGTRNVQSTIVVRRDGVDAATGGFDFRQFRHCRNSGPYLIFDMPGVLHVLAHPDRGANRLMSTDQGRLSWRLRRHWAAVRFGSRLSVVELVDLGAVRWIPG
jgi:hypothetical protein